MALTKIGTDGVKDDAITSGKIPANAVGSSEIADQAVTLDKLPHGTSSNDGKFLRANNGADPSFETISIPAGVGGATGVDFNDNVLARFGTGNDLELKHDGSHSYLGNNTGYLYLQSDSISLAGKSAGQNYLVANLNGALSLGHSGNTKLETTSTGINITGGIRVGGNNAANELDDYEEGSWTPTASGFTISNNYSGNYTKIGNVVYIQMYIQAASGSGSSAVTVGGLPYTVKSGNYYSYAAGRMGGSSVQGYDKVFEFINGTANIQLRVADGPINEGMISGQHLIMSGFYHV